MMRRKKSGLVTVLITIALGAVTGCGPSGPKVGKDQLNIVLITLDTTRQDQLGCYGNSLGITPRLDQLAREGVLFKEAVSPVPLTTPSHSSMLTGLYPFRHGVRGNGFFRLGDAQVTVTEILQDNGFTTAAMIAAFVLDQQFRLDQGFDVYNDDLSRGYQKTRYSIVERPAELVTQAATAWLEEHHNERFFLWVHYYDPHHPYNPPAGFSRFGDTEFERYQGEIAYMDQNVGQILDALKRLGVYDRTVIAAVGDHGEAFGEHNEAGHAYLIYNTTQLVPWIIRLPEIEDVSIRRGHRVGGRVNLVDLTPTLLDLVGLDPPGPLDGISLVPYMEGTSKNRDRPFYAESAHGRLTRQWSQICGLYSGKWKYILAPTPELYDLSNDPGEERNLAAVTPSQSDKMRERLIDLVMSRGVTSSSSSQLELDAESEERLRSLGYISGATPSDEDIRAMDSGFIEACQTGKDPKDMMEFSNLIGLAMGALTEDRPRIGLHALKQAQQMDGESILTLSLLSTAYSQLKLFDAAIEILNKILESLPNDSRTLTSLAIAHNDKGESRKAAEIMRGLVNKSPHYHEFHLNLANIYDDLQEYDLADQEYEAALRLAPDEAGKKDEVRYNLAVSLFRREQWARSKEELEEILRSRPDNSGARSLLHRVSRQLAQESS